MNLFKKYPEILVFLFYFLITIIFTYPLIFKLTEVIWGYSGDNFGSIWQVWWLKYASINHLSKDFSPLVNYPFGSSIGLATILEPLWFTPLAFFSRFFNEVAVFNLFIFLSFPLSGLTAYQLTKHISQNTLASIFAGLIFMLAPYHFWQSYAHISLALIQWLPLYFLFLLKLDQFPSWKRGLLTGLSFGLVILTSSYLGFFMVLLTIAFILGKIIFRVLKNRANYLNWERVKALLIAFLISLLLILPTYSSFFKFGNTGSENALDAHKRNIMELLALSLRPWDFLIPAPDQVVFGKYENSIHEKIRSISNDYKTISAFLPERVIYIGWTTLVLSVIGFWVAFKRKNKKEFALVSLFSIIVLTLISFPPFIYIKGFKLLLPSYFLYQILPIFRVYARLGIIILLLLLPFSALGLSFYLDKIKSNFGKFILAGGFSLLIMFEFLNFPPYHVSDLSKLSPSYQWLANQKENFAIAEYPKTYDIPDILFYQRIHQKPFYNLNASDSPYSVLNPFVDNLNASTTAPLLATLGIKYVVVHTALPPDKQNSFDELNFTRVVLPAVVGSLKAGGNDFKIIQEFPDSLIVQVIAKPEKLAILEPKGVTLFPKDDIWNWNRRENTFYLTNLNKEDEQIRLSFNFLGQSQEVTTTVFEKKTLKTTNSLLLTLKPGVNLLKFQLPSIISNEGIKDIKIEVIK